jgi:hypothetical protein
MKSSELIYDWNRIHPGSLRPMGHVLLNDETLRDGLQSPSVRDPLIGEKIEILHLMEALESMLLIWDCREQVRGRWSMSKRWRARSFSTR